MSFKAYKIVIILTVLLLALPLKSPSNAIDPAESYSSAEVKRVEKAIEVMKEFVHLPEGGIPEALLGKSYAIAIIPEVIKAAYGLGGQYGKGIIAIKNEAGEWSNSAFITLVGGSIGWQIGVQKADIVLVFRTRGSLDNITKGKFTLGADVSVTAGPVGRSAEASTDVELEAEIYSYSKSKGLFAGVSIKGSSIQIDEEAGQLFYDQQNISAREILTSNELKAPEIAERLKETLTRYVRETRKIRLS